MQIQKSTRRFAYLVLVAATILLPACQKAPEKTETTQPAAASPSQPAGSAATPVTQTTPTSSPAPMPATQALASAQYSADPDLRCDLLEAKRVSGGAVIVRWRLINTAGGQSSGSLAASEPKAINYDFSWPEIYYIDPAENKKYGFLTDSENNRIIDVYYGNLAAGQQRLNWAKFPAPPATSTKISINIPKFPPFEDVPLS